MLWIINHTRAWICNFLGFLCFFIFSMTPVSQQPTLPDSDLFMCCDEDEYFYILHTWCNVHGLNLAERPPPYAPPWSRSFSRQGRTSLVRSQNVQSGLFPKEILAVTSKHSHQVPNTLDLERSSGNLQQLTSWIIIGLFHLRKRLYIIISKINAQTLRPKTTF